GYSLAVFPTLSSLRYAIPWQTIPSLIDWLHEEADQALETLQPKIAFMSEDGEKFGTWPGTYEHCWGEGKYMESLFSALDKNSAWLKTSTPGELIAQYPALGRIYLPASSYAEMGEWSLPPEQSHQLSELTLALEREKRLDII